METPRYERIEALVRADVPLDAMAFYGRWWQFERWLREIAYVEMRAKYGARWTHTIGWPSTDARDQGQRQRLHGVSRFR
jgi:hypothetical protein